MIKRYSSVTYNTLEILIDHLDFFKNATLQFEILSLTHMIKNKDVGAYKLLLCVIFLITAIKGHS